MHNSLYAPSLTTCLGTENLNYFFITARALSPPGGGEGIIGRGKMRFWGACGAQKTRFPYVAARFARCALREPFVGISDSGQPGRPGEPFVGICDSGQQATYMRKLFGGPRLSES